MDIYPAVSVVIPTYNYEKYICNAVESILTQTYPLEKIEIIVVDDGSTDDTRKVLQPYIESGKLSYHYQQNKGKASATSYAVALSRGKYIFNLDADDLFYEDKISAFVTVYEQDESIVHVASAAKVIYAHDTSIDDTEAMPKEITDKPIEGRELLRFFYENNILYGGGSTYSARSSALKNISISAESDMYIDEFLILALLQLGKSYLFSKPLSVWNVHSNNYSGKIKNMDERIAKGERLLSSSKAVLDYVQANSFEEKIKKTYELIHANREIAFKEGLNRKGIKDIAGFGRMVLLSGLPVSTMKKYSFLNRLLPTSVIAFLKSKKN